MEAAAIKTFKAFILLFLLCSTFFVSIIKIDTVGAETQTALFRPIYSGGSKGTVGPYVYATNTSAINREINLIGWTVSRLVMYVRWAMPKAYFGGLTPYVLYPSSFWVYFSQDNGATYPIKRNFPAKILVNPIEVGAGPLGFYGFQDEYDISPSDYGLFGPTTRIKIEIPGGLPNLYLVNNYFATGQKPVPPYDYIDASDNYVQYDVWFTAEYTEQQISYVGQTIDFSNLTLTQSKLRIAADMIVNTMQLSGASNEVVGKSFGTDSWIIIYSSQLAMMELLNFMKTSPEKSYLVPVKRFIVWMWSKQNTGDGSFPFILTDGDQHPWYDETYDLWYGNDKIDSFSACAISLMCDYYDATGDVAFINSYWSQIYSSKEFITSLMNTTYWLPVDGWHYDNDTGYTKSTMNWLHDCCEAYQGLKDYAYLEGIRGNTTEQTYWNGYANSIANGIRTYFWNETLGRYAGIFYIDSGTQDTVRVYNMITPIIYDIETNVTRASGTIAQYVQWGILSGRYYDRPWAADYSVFNEYSTMSGMIYAAFAKLIQNFNYSEVWMKTKFIEVSKFLFTNPIYPDANLQNADGLLDYVNLVNYTWASEYARLIETSAWFINGFIQTPNMSSLYNYTLTDLLTLNNTLTTEQTYWNTQYEEFKSETGSDRNTIQGYPLWVNWLKNKQLYVQWYDFEFLKYMLEHEIIGEDGLPWWETWTPPPEWLEDIIITDFTGQPTLPILFIVGMIGLVSMISGPSYAVYKIKKKEYEEGLVNGVIIFAIGLGFFVGWLAMA